MTTIHRAALAALLLLLVACAPAVPEEETAHDLTKVAQGSLKTVYRIVDGDAQIACWIYVGVEQGGIDCLPL